MIKLFFAGLYEIRTTDNIFAKFTLFFHSLSGDSLRLWNSFLRLLSFLSFHIPISSISFVYLSVSSSASVFVYEHTHTYLYSSMVNREARTEMTDSV